MALQKKVDSLVIEGVTYVPQDSLNKAEQVDGLDYVIIRAEGAGVFAGYLQKEDGDTVVLVKARRLWYWDGASSLSELATHGTAKPTTCKFPCEVSKIKIMNVLEILDCTEKARLSIQSVVIWSQND
jgi:hypothetical protein